MIPETPSETPRLTIRQTLENELAWFTHRASLVQRQIDMLNADPMFACRLERFNDISIEPPPPPVG